MSEQSNPFLKYDYHKSVSFKLHERVLAEFKRRSVAEQVQTMVDVGILNPDGSLAVAYGGEASPPSSQTPPQPPT